MPEEKNAQAEAEPQPQPTVRKRVGPALVAVAILVVLAVVFAMVMLRGGKPQEELTGKTHKESGNPEYLDLPALEVANVMVSVPVDSAGVQRRGLSVGVAVFFVPPEGEHANIEELKKELAVKTPALGAIFRHIVIKELNTKGYNELVKADIQDGLLGYFKQKFEAELDEYGLNKTVHVARVVWSDFSWN